MKLVYATTLKNGAEIRVEALFKWSIVTPDSRAEGEAGSAKGAVDSLAESLKEAGNPEVADVERSLTEQLRKDLEEL